MKAKNSATCVLPVSAESVLALGRQDLACYTLANYPSFQMPPFLELVINKLEAVERGDIRRLVISLPPRHGKSLLVSHHFPAWYLGRHPDRYVIAASYGQELADDFGRRVRNTVQAPLHRSIFPESRLAEGSAAMHRFDLTAGGAYYAVGRGAAITGRGAHLLSIDDPLKDAEEANSPTIRRMLQQWFAQVAFTRLMPDAAVIVTTTRWHEDDLAGWLLREFAAEGWETLVLPAIAEPDDPIGRAEGEALWPERYPLETLQSIRRQLGSAAFASLYQQRPAPIEGRMFRREWWRFYSVVPQSFTQVVMSIDSAFKTGQENDFSAITIWGNTASDGIHLLHAWRGKVEFPELKRTLKTFAAEWKPNVILIEDKASGQSLIQEMQRETNLPIVAVKADTDKITRAAAVTPLVEAGKVLLPQAAGWLDDYLDELCSFPAAPHDDYVDSTTQALQRMTHGGIGAGWGVFEFYRQRAEQHVPKISTLSPPSGSVAGGEVLTLTGENLSGASVEIDGAMATITASTDTEIRFVAPPHGPGAVNVTVKTAGGSTVSRGGYAYLDSRETPAS